jgi:hypothetical protein
LPSSPLSGHIANISDDGLTSFIKLDTSRAKDFQLVGSMILLLYHLPNLVDLSARHLEKFVDSADPPDKSFKQHVDSVFSLLHTVASDERFNYPFQSWAKLSPVEFVFVGGMLSRLGNFIPNNIPVLARAAERIYAMRTQVRKVHTDIRMNSKVGKTLHAFIMSVAAENGDDALEDGFSGTEPRKRRKIRQADDEDYRPGRQGSTRGGKL